MRQKLLKLKETDNLYNMSLDIGISESSLYNYMTERRKVSTSILEKIKKYLEEKEIENITNNV